MKLLFDQNLASSLVKHFSDAYPGSAHTITSDLARQLIWRFGSTRETTDSLSFRRMLIPRVVDRVRVPAQNHLASPGELCDARH